MAHEFTHGVVRTTAGLKYRFQSGALNEHYADFFATMIDTSDWGVRGPGGTGRNLSRRVQLSQFVVTTADDDHGGVHSNSAIPNHAGYLAARVIGRDKAEQIWYATLLRLGPNTGFGPWACATISTARQMRRAGSLTLADVIAVEEAMITVGLVSHAGFGSRSGEVELCFIAARGEGPSAEECAARAADPLLPDCLLGAGSSGAPPEGTVAHVDSAAPPATTDAAAPATTEPGDVAPPDTTEPPSSAAAPVVCFPGVWELRSQDFIDQIIAIAGGDLPPGGEIVYHHGSYVVSAAADGTTIDHRDEWTWAMSASGMTIYVIFDGVETGTWEVEHGADPTTGTLHVQTTGGSITVRIESSMGPLPGGPQSFPAEALGASATYTADTELHELVVFRLADDEERPVGELAELPPAELLAALGEPHSVLLAAPGGPEIPAVGDGVLAEPGRYALFCFIPTGADVDEYLSAAGDPDHEGPPQVDGGPPHFVHGMYAELTVEP